MLKVVDQWIEQGRMLGREEGPREGWREGERRGLLAGIEVILELKFGADGLGLMPGIRAITDVDRLRTVQSALRSAASLDEVRPLLA
jgi:hypothetical protein